MGGMVEIMRYSVKNKFWNLCDLLLGDNGKGN